eukprot:CAMPEP_0113961870 /NCGR_PEP_ID=MMETSP0011_2-20120614/5576_1 /TAXON_ID=101924 /ORGANISM="Rhodosorus marinus" /LENGTH=575 /DNA_ID=CAMNT_0000973613 /DNA_START=388 /DNA_END=2115 /DNA_ORIENTATION=+ /assembly_acc=CAM_ASM_000156
MDELESDLRLPTVKRTGLIARFEGEIGNDRGRISVIEEEPTESSLSVPRTPEGLDDNKRRRNVVLRFNGSHSEDAADGDEVTLHFSDVLAVRRRASCISFWAHGGALLLKLMTTEGKGMLNALVQREILDAQGPGLYVPSNSISRRIFESNDASLEPPSTSLVHSLRGSILEQLPSSSESNPSSNLSTTFARVPKALKWWREYNQPFLTEIGFGQTSSTTTERTTGKEDLTDLEVECAEDGPLSPFPDHLTPVYHIAKYLRGVPVGAAVLETSMDEEGKFSDYEVFKIAIGAGGLAPDLRRTVWPFLAGVYNWDSTRNEREAKAAKMIEKYESLKSAAQARKDSKEELNPKAGENDRLEGDPIEQIQKDVHRTDRDVKAFQEDDAPLLGRMEELLYVYAVENPAIGYCQGMSDLISPLLWAFREDHQSMTYFCFAEIMSRQWSQNFLHSGGGISKQLEELKSLTCKADPDIAQLFEVVDPSYYSLYRWTLVHFKRELEFPDVARLWEVIWLDWNMDLHLYVALGLLVRHRDQVLSGCSTFDRLLKFINLMSQRLDVDLALRDAIDLRKKYSCKDM